MGWWRRNEGNTAHSVGRSLDRRESRPAYPKAPEPWGLRRRTLLTSAAYGVPALAVGVSDTARWRKETFDYYLDRVVINGVNVIACVTEHNRAAWEYCGGFIQEAVETADVVIPEYFPDEYRHLRGHPVMGSSIRAMDEANFMFVPLAEACQRMGKNVWVVDPAYNEAFGWTVGGANLVEHFARGYTLAVAATGPFGVRDAELSKEDVERQRRFSRRAMVKAAAGAGFLGAGITGAVAGGLPPTLPLERMLERSFRQTIVASHVKNLCRTGRFERGSDVVIFYPRNQWEENGNTRGIKHYLQNDRECAATVAFFEISLRFATPMPTLNSQFLARNYPDGRYSELREVVPLGSDHGSLELR